MQTQRTVLWIIFSMSLLFLWDAWQKHQGKPSLFSAAPTTSQSTGSETSASPATAASSSATVPSATGTSTTPTAPGDKTVPQASSAVVPPTGGGVSAASASAQQPPVRLANDVLSLEIDLVGGEVQRAELLKYRESTDAKGSVVLLNEKTGHVYVAQLGLIGAPQGVVWPTHRTPFTASSGSAVMAEGQDEVSLTLSAESGGVRVIRRYALKRSEYLLRTTTEVHNLSDAPIRPTQYLQLTRDASKPPGESQFYSTYTGPVVYTDTDRFQKVDFGDIEKGKKDLHAKSANDGWAGIIQHYFVSAWIPAQGSTREYFTRKVDTNLYSVGMLEALKDIEPAGKATVSANLFVGPQDQKLLASIAPGLDLSVDYGIFAVFAKPLFWLLQFLYGIVQNWGWAIVLLTLVVKLAFFPLQAASYRSMANMKRVTPKLQQLRERYGNDRVKMNQAMMELYKTEKINPLGGCLPVVVQIPVFIALYWVLLASVEMRNAPWLGWIQDLSAPDTLFGTIPGLDMPIGLLPLLMAASMIVQTRLNPTPPDPLQAKMMMWMPIIFSVMFFFFPAGLVLYWLVNNLFSIAQQWVITRRIEGKPVFGKAG
jgi:YidC/Oxa1 family membrane protein insertase